MSTIIIYWYMYAFLLFPKYTKTKNFVQELMKFLKKIT